RRRSPAGIGSRPRSPPGHPHRHALQHAGGTCSQERNDDDQTGIMPYIKGLPTKKIELAREIVHHALTIGIVNNSSDVKALGQWDEIEAAAPKLDIKIASVLDVLRVECTKCTRMVGGHSCNRAMIPRFHRAVSDEDR